MTGVVILVTNKQIWIRTLESKGMSSISIR